jgi:hypothetical protein
MTNNKQQTAVEWQHIELSKFLNGKSEFTDAHDILIKAKEMEKEQIMKAHISAGARLEDISIEAAEEYYKQTYGGGEQ